MKDSTESEKNIDKSLKIILIGEGGQGIQTIAKIISRAAFNRKYHASYIPNFGTEQRGGLSLAFIQISKRPIISPKFKTADLFITVTDRDIDRTLRYIGQNTHILYDQDLLEKSSSVKFKKISSSIVQIRPFHKAITDLTERSFNVILIGILTGLIDADLEKEVISVMDSKFEKYYSENPKLKDLNHKGFNIGFDLTKK